MENREMQMARRIAEQVAVHGGRTFFVGGFVRDRLQGKENKDIDIEIHGILPEMLENILQSLGKMTEMGASFGIFGLRSYDLDIAMPRKEEATGRGHKDFAVYVDPFLGTYKAALRRDFTMNALMEDVLTGEVVDHFGGMEDMKNGILRHVNAETFVEDPLRVLRAAQFAARFHFRVAEETIVLARTMDLTALARERILGELEKALKKADMPSIFFEEMVKMEQMRDWFPEMEALQRQGRWEHTMCVLDAAAKVLGKVEEPISFMMLALTHAFESKESRKQFLERVTNETKVIKYVENMASLWREPKILALQGANEKMTNTLFDRALSARDLVLFAVLVDEVERSLKSSMEYELYQAAAKSEFDNFSVDMSQEELQSFLERRLAVFERVMAKPYVMGADLIRAGMKPSKSFSQILAYAHELRLEGVDKAAALSQTLEYAAQMKLQ